MVLLIRQSLLNGYFIGSIPYFQTNPCGVWRFPEIWDTKITKALGFFHPKEFWMIWGTRIWVEPDIYVKWKNQVLSVLWHFVFVFHPTGVPWWWWWWWWWWWRLRWRWRRWWLFLTMMMVIIADYHHWLSLLLLLFLIILSDFCLKKQGLESADHHQALEMKSRHFGCLYPWPVHHPQDGWFPAWHSVARAGFTHRRLPGWQFLIYLLPATYDSGMGMMGFSRENSLETIRWSSIKGSRIPQQSLSIGLRTYLSQQCPKICLLKWPPSWKNRPADIAFSWMTQSTWVYVH